MEIMTENGWRRIRFHQQVIHAPKDPTLMESLGLANKPDNSAEMYIAAIDEYLSGTSNVRAGQSRYDLMREKMDFAISGGGKHLLNKA